jgi:hypothetical protein
MNQQKRDHGRPKKKVTHYASTKRMNDIVRYCCSLSYVYDKQEKVKKGPNTSTIPKKTR